MSDRKAPSWKPVCTLQDTEERPMLAVRVEGRHLLIIRAGGALHACERACPHEQADLAMGRCSGNKLFCPRHFVSFDLADGRVSGGWDIRPLRVYPVRITGEEVAVDISGIPSPGSKSADRYVADPVCPAS